MFDGQEEATRRADMIRRLGFRIALPFALFLGIAEVVRNWGDWGFWPFWVVDYIAVALLIWAWWAVRSRKAGGTSLLAGAWGFTCAMFYMGFFAHLESLGVPERGPIEQRPLTLINGNPFGGHGCRIREQSGRGEGRSGATPRPGGGHQ